jgi:hypothetical protein
MSPTRWFAALLLCCSLPALAQFPTAQFTQDEVVVLESAGFVELTITISGPGFGGLPIFTQNESATAPLDFAAQSTWLNWSGGDATPRQFQVPLVSDALSEGEESFLVRLGSGDGVDPGVPATLRVRIVDDTSSPQAFFVLPDGIPLRPDGSAVFAAEGGSDLVLTLRLAEFPQSPVAIQYVVEPGGASQQVLFVDTQSVELAIPSPVADPGDHFVRRSVRILSPNPKFDAEWFETWYAFLEDFFGDPCSYCVVNLVLAKLGIGTCDNACAIVYGSECDLPPSKGGAPTTILRRYRDEILASTPAGQAFIELYESVSPSAVSALLRDPTLPFDIWRAQDDWIAAIAALTDDAGATVSISTKMESDLIDLTTRLIALGGEGTAEVAQALNALTLEPLSGLTMLQFQTRVELVGGGVPMRQESWGALKSHY